MASPPTSMPPADLVVDAPTVSDSTPEAGASFTLSATVRNRENGRSASTTLRYYRSDDATISSADTSVGTDSVSGLNASGSSDESISLTAPDRAGTYYYGACVDPVLGETDTGNNCSDGVAVTVGAAPAPDLAVDTPTVSNDNPAAGSTFTLSATVRNQGSGASGGTTLRYYRSADATIGSSDTSVGTDAVAALSASGSSDESISLTAPSEAGTYYYGACVDEVSEESDAGNNCSTAVAVAVGAAPTPDLVVETPTVSDAAPVAGATFTLSATVRNQGSGRVGFHHPALLPFHRRHHHQRRRVGGNRLCESSRSLRERRRDHQPDRSGQRGHLLLRGVRGRGNRGIQHRQQLLRRSGGKR